MSSSPILGIPEIAPTQADKTTTINDAVLALEGATQAQLAVDLSGGAVTLTALQYTRNGVFICSGETANTTLTVPLTPRVFLARNDGAHNVVVGGTTGATVTLAAGDAKVIQNDGTGCSVFAIGGTGGAGGITQLVAGAGLAGGTISSTGTISLGTIAADSLLGNAGTVGAVPTAIVIGAGLTVAAGTIAATGGATQWNAGTVTAVGNGLEINGGTIAADTQGTVTASTTHTAISPTGLQSVLVNMTSSTTLDINSGYVGQHLRLELKQDATGSRTVTLGTSIAVGTDIATFTASTAASARDLVQMINATGTVWMLAAVNKGFAV